jgi:hypothetical protein
LKKNKRIFAGNTTSKVLTVMNKLLPAVFRWVSLLLPAGKTLNSESKAEIKAWAEGLK